MADPHRRHARLLCPFLPLLKSYRSGLGLFQTGKKSLGSTGGSPRRYCWPPLDLHMKNPTEEIVSESGVPGGAEPIAKFRPLRVWPALVLVGLIIVARLGPAYMEG